MRVFNQYSFALTGLIIFILAAVLILRRVDNPWRIILVFLVAGVLVISWVSLRPQQGTKASFLFFDAQGQEAYRTVGRLDVNQIKILLADQQ